MRKTLVLALVLGLIAGLLSAPATAQKKKKRPKPVETTLYMEGTERLGEMESFSLLADGYLQLTAEEPESSDSKSKQLTNYVGGPNTNCAGNTLFPTFVGDLSGRVKGDVTITFDVVSTPAASVELRLWPDVQTLACNDEYIEPAASVQVALPAGQGTVEAVIEEVNFRVQRVLMLQVTPVLTPPFFGRMFYGSTASPSNLEFKCIPARGKSCTP